MPSQIGSQCLNIKSPVAAAALGLARDTGLATMGIPQKSGRQCESPAGTSIPSTRGWRRSPNGSGRRPPTSPACRRSSASTRSSRGRPSKASATTSRCTARRATTGSPCSPRRRWKTSAAACRATTATTTPAISRRWSRAPFRCASPRSICRTAIPSGRRSSATSWRGWSGCAGTWRPCWSTRSPWPCSATTT